MSNIDAYKKYIAPKASGNYFKLEDGETGKIRIASDAFVYQDSYKGQKKPTPSYAWVIWNFTEERVQVWQASLTSFKTIQALILDEDWGDPEEYNLTIRREGSSTDTKYHITPSPNKSPLKDVLDINALDQIVAFDIFEVMKDKKLVSLADAADGAELDDPDQGSGDVVIKDLDPNQSVNLDDIPF